MDEGDLTTSTMLIDATTPYHWKDEFPPRNRIPDDVRDQVAEK